MVFSVNTTCGIETNMFLSSINDKFLISVNLARLICGLKAYKHINCIVLGVILTENIFFCEKVVTAIIILL